VALDEVDEYLEREVDHLEREVDHLEREDEHLEREDEAIEEQQVALGATRLDAARSAETAAAAAAAAAPDRSRQRKPSNDRPPKASTPRSSQGTVQDETLGGAHAEMGDKACRNGVCVASNLCEPSRSTHSRHLKELERARARGRQRGLEEARRKAREQFGLDACSAHQWLA
jgi:hypothetical protein